MYNATEQASTMYYLYISDEGETIISDISPYFRAELRGEYHPHNPWRCVGLAFNDGSSDIRSAGGVSANSTSYSKANAWNGFGSTYVRIRKFLNHEFETSPLILYKSSGTLGDTFTTYWPCEVHHDLIEDTEAGVIAGITVNSTSPSTSLTTGSTAEELAYSNIPTGGNFTMFSPTYFSKVGDVFRSHTNGSGNATASDVQSFWRVSAKPINE
jgi:hypothetical protein